MNEWSHLVRILLTILLIIPTHIFAASNAETVNQIVAKYSAQCDAKQDAVEYGEVIPEAARLSVSDDSLYEIQITLCRLFMSHHRRFQLVWF